MKKIYAFMAAALMSASLFAAPDKAPGVEDLANVGDLANDVVLALYFDEEVCNDLVLVGTYNEWNTDDVEALTRFEKLEGFDGWYVAAFPWAEGAAGKAVQLKSDGTFDWKFQTGDVDAWINQGGKEATIEAGYDGESNVSYSEPGAYIYEIAYFKLHNSPCEVVPKHKYTIVFLDPYCEENDEFVPAIAGDHNGWTPSPLSEGTHEGDFAWVIVVETEEGNAFKFLEYTYWEANNKSWDNQFEWYDAENDQWKQFGNSAFPAATQDTTLVIDYSDLESYRYPMCGVEQEDPQLVILGLKAPADAPVAGIELMGSWGENTWNEGIVMTFNEETGWYVILSEANLFAKSGNEFKFREVGTWDNQIVKAATGDELPNFKFGDVWTDDTWKGEPCKFIELDLSSDEYAWKANWVDPRGIENVVLTEKANKVVVDGVLYIVRDNKMFNLQGAQVR